MPPSPSRFWTKKRAARPWAVPSVDETTPGSTETRSPLSEGTLPTAMAAGYSVRIVASEFQRGGRYHARIRPNRIVSGGENNDRANLALVVDQKDGSHR